MSVVIPVDNAGLGNHLFRLASGFGLCKRFNKQMKSTGTNKHRWLYQQLPISNIRSVVVTEKSDKFGVVDENIIQAVKSHNHVTIRGYMQCPEYFDEYKQDIVNMFELPTEIKSKFTTLYPDFDNNSYALHVRLEDYIGCKKHFVDLSNYYAKILNQICVDDVKIHVFSSGSLQQIFNIYPVLKEYEKHMKFMNVNTPKNRQEDITLIDLYGMTQCHLGVICANSSFSWWGAYLNNGANKQVFMPSVWLYMPMHSGLRIFPKDAIVVDV